MANQSSPNNTPQTSPLGCLIRLYWLVLGKAVLFLSALKIALSENGKQLTALDFVYASGIVSLLMVRYLDIQYFNGESDAGTRATLADWRRYAITLIPVSLAMLGAAHGIAMLLQRN